MSGGKSPAPPQESLTTRKPWVVAGISRTAFKGLEARGLGPRRTYIAGLTRPLYLIEDVRAWLLSQSQPTTA